MTNSYKLQEKIKKENKIIVVQIAAACMFLQYLQLLLQMPVSHINNSRLECFSCLCILVEWAYFMAMIQFDRLTHVLSIRKESTWFDLFKICIGFTLV